MAKCCILGVHVTDRVRDAASIQGICTEFGCNIKTRLGLHDVLGEFCSPSGIILLELVGEQTACEELAKRLNAVEGVEVQKMVFGE